MLISIMEAGNNITNQKGPNQGNDLSHNFFANKKQRYEFFRLQCRRSRYT